ncbi:DUF3291 domain-containing protein [Streptantibioticus ferralitis]|uniref:DUF3291 domain-containing protein n=1 Tax=Streptantibioticus ferralitis TaxID=236510 RepID=A0ABT5Z4P3_9ACTN|nr:DUF3291 domain-containing protein [Streptantibioticus ferralitis]MDF2258787.1 DUF3291 domain-containing protein [Streptantibioticus ferralitis]
MLQLALYTFGVLKSPLSDPAPLTREFHETAEAVYREIGQYPGCQYPGYVARAEASDRSRGTLFDRDWGEWGEFAVPAWYLKGRTAESTALAATLSLWTDLRSASDFIFTGLHRAALDRRDDWFEKSGRPGHVLWWVTEGTVPTWQDGVSRLEHLHDHDPAPYAFTFHHSFDPDGTSTRLAVLGRSGTR